MKVRGKKMTMPRMWEWVLATVLLVGALLFIAPENGKVMLYKLGLVTLAAVLGYWLDRTLFRASQPGTLKRSRVKGANVPYAAAMIRRALIVSAAILGVALGL